MAYSVKQLACLAHVSERTLRYYDQIGLLRPARSPAGYRLYEQGDVKRLQQILLYCEMGIALKDIAALLEDEGFDLLKALNNSKQRLIAQRQRLDVLIANIDRTISHEKGEGQMKDEQRFEGFKREMIAQNEEQYGQEIREKYGDAQIDGSNAKLMGLTKEQYEACSALEEGMRQMLIAAYHTGDPAGKLAQQAADLHRQWICYFWKEYSKQAHAGLAQMYIEDERFTKYYDAYQPGLAAFLCDAISVYTRA